LQIKMKSRALIIIFSVLLYIPNTAAADDVLTLGKGTHHFKTILTSASVIRRSVGRQSFSLGVGYGYFLTDFLEPYLVFRNDWFSSFNRQIVSVGLRGWIDLENRIFPFIEVDGGLNSQEFDISGIGSSRSTNGVFGAGGGAMYLITKNVGLALKLRYDREPGGANELEVPVEFSVFF
jgi:hypothetical protein